MILAATSALHGNDVASKGVLIAASALAYGVIGYFTIHYYGVLAMILSVAWWFLLRGSKQARVELDRMDTWNAPYPSCRDVMKAHYYTGILTVLALRVWNYNTTPHLVNNGKFWDCRRPTEVATGLTGDLIICILILTTYLWRH